MRPNGLVGESEGGVCVYGVENGVISDEEVAVDGDEENGKEAGRCRLWGGCAAVDDMCGRGGVSDSGES